MYKISSWNMIFTKCPEDFWHKRKIYNFDPYNVFLAIATNISPRLKTGFVLQGHICIKHNNDKHIKINVFVLFNMICFNKKTVDRRF